MIKFILKGILRDKSRSVLPTMVITIGVFLTVFLICWLTGVLGDMVDMNARFTTGHVNIQTRAYAKLENQKPNDLAIIGSGEIISKLESNYPQMSWHERIHFGGLLDVPDENGETRAQGPAAGMAIDMLSPESAEIERLNIPKSLVTGKIPSRAGEALISADFAQKKNVKPGDRITLFGSTMNGGMAFYNFTVSGTIRWGVVALDRGSIIIDIRDARLALDMDNSASEILGYFRDETYNDLAATEVANSFNAVYENSDDEFAPLMRRLREQGFLSSYLDYVDGMSGIMVTVFIFAMSIVLWNTGLLGGLRRYTEFGVRLALGENKGHIYRNLLYEATLIGVIGSVFGTILGLAISYYLQENGLDFSGSLQNSTMMMPAVFRTNITSEAYYIGFIPGVFSMVLGTALSGIGIYKRQTAQLFKELEV